MRDLRRDGKVLPQSARAAQRQPKIAGRTFPLTNPCMDQWAERVTRSTHTYPAWDRRIRCHLEVRSATRLLPHPTHTAHVTPSTRGRVIPSSRLPSAKRNGIRRGRAFSARVGVDGTNRFWRPPRRVQPSAEAQAPASRRPSPGSRNDGVGSRNDSPEVQLGSQRGRRAYRRTFVCRRRSRPHL